jgi:hypothetical protein
MLNSTTGADPAGGFWGSPWRPKMVNFAAKVTIFQNCWGKEEFPASRSVPTLMVLNKDRKYVISLFFQLFLWFISGQTKVHWRLSII